jgi:uncharacterized protein YndB with AHSA1/START domain/predicted enzyme related to lactoylglutathione lyase
MNPANPTTTLHVRRFIPAPRARVFAAFTNSEDLTKWLGPGPCQCLKANVEPRLGGVFDVHMRLSDGSEGYIRGKYLEVRSPERLVFTWSWEGTTRCVASTSQVSVDFVEVDNGTDVQLTHENLANPVERDNHAHGWMGCFDKLERLFSPEAAESTNPPAIGEFCWNELITSDVKVAGKFYTELFGWNSAPFGGPIPYTLFKQGEKSMGGMMAQMQPGTPPLWLSYVSVADCDASAAKAVKLGAKLCMPPKDIPTVGRIAILNDPLGASFGLFRPEGKS